MARRFAENLANAREGAGITQEELRYRAALRRTEVGLLERGARVPRIDTLVKLACALEVEAQELYPDSPGSQATSSQEPSTSLRRRSLLKAEALDRDPSRPITSQ